MAHIPLRMCVACRTMRPASDMIRIVSDKNSNTADLDIYKKKFGRGAYICKSIDCIKKAEKKRGLERHLGISNAEDIYRQAGDLV